MNICHSSKVISGETPFEYLIGRCMHFINLVKLIFEFNKKTKSSVKFGTNTIFNLVQKEESKEITLIFVFYDDKLKMLIDLLNMKVKAKDGFKLYLLDKSFKYNLI